MLDMESQNIMFLDFGLDVVPFLSIPVFLLFRMGKFTLCCCKLEMFNFPFDFYRAPKQFAWILKKDFGHEL